MRRVTRYAIALLAASVVTGAVAVEYHSIVLLPGVFVTYAAGISVALRYPDVLLWDGVGNRAAPAVSAGGTTFGVLSLAQGLGDGIHFGAGALGFGLVVFGAASGIWLADVAET